MNFLVYTEVGVTILDRIVDEYMSKPVFIKDIQDDRVSPMLMLEIYYFITTLIVVLGLFNAFHWYLVLSGKTTLECCFSDPRYTPSKNWGYNLSLVFGTHNPIFIFLPKFSIIPNKGFEWGIIQPF